MNRQALIEQKDDIIILQSAFLRSKSLKSRKILGQFFTGSVVSDYMASLVAKPKSKIIRILDAGAGTGILTASTALYCLSMGCKTVHAVLYELDSEAVASLNQTLNIVQCLFGEQLGTFTYEICCEDFVIARPDKEKTVQPFDISVINPPYFKYSAKDSPYAKAVAESIAFGNKINYIGVLGSELSTIEAFGLATVLNSSFMDKYFRCISGNTQVNATETRVMKFPSRDQIKEIGDRVHKLKLFETAIIDSIVNPVLGVVDSM